MEAKSNLNPSDDISFKELIFKIRQWWRYLVSKKKLIILTGLIGAFIGFFYAFQQKIEYKAILTFALEEEKGGASGMSGALGLASSLGLDLGSNGSGGIFAGANIMDLMKSRNVVEKTLLSPVKINNKEISLADYYIMLNHINDKWETDSLLKGLSFTPSIVRSSFTRQQDSVLGILYKSIVNSKLSIYQKDKKAGIIAVEFKYHNELFAKLFTETISQVVSDFYVETKSKKAKLNYDILQKQVDSIRRELNGAITGVASATEETFNLNSALNVQRATSQKRQVDVQANTAILTQLVANLEMSKVSLRKETPLIQVIDYPILPLDKERVSKIKSLLIGFLVSVVLVVLFLSIQRVIRFALDNH
jgi:uncharacterized protein involved in exopolysaccharide biosynthesis